MGVVTYFIDYIPKTVKGGLEELEVGEGGKLFGGGGGAKKGYFVSK